MRSYQLFFRRSLWKKFRKNKAALLSTYVLGIMIFFALLAPLLANEKPLFVKYGDDIFFPAFSVSDVTELKNKETEKKELTPSDQVDWKHMKLDRVIWAPVAYSPGKSDQVNTDYSAPSAKTHWLGTTRNGSDVFSGLIHAARNDNKNPKMAKIFSTHIILFIIPGLIIE